LGFLQGLDFLIEVVVLLEGLDIEFVDAGSKASAEVLPEPSLAAGLVPVGVRGSEELFLVVEGDSSVSGSCWIVCHPEQRVSARNNVISFRVPLF
jgi:hypothetical protein